LIVVITHAMYWTSVSTKQSYHSRRRIKERNFSQINKNQSP